MLRLGQEADGVQTADATISRAGNEHADHVALLVEGHGGPA